ncbi:hypothetical protein BN137_69 [Cronobacter condimenti 1330]|uniref:Uncharacterized protein n=1 Tax=Cronobacter condimenti 1330 TaxID=1073999 RepID=K7ZX82_9ENTR|nr:hypothetical protein BN137_69 [Cronobacter condimenti 1330]
MDPVIVTQQYPHNALIPFLVLNIEVLSLKACPFFILFRFR